MSSFKYPEIPFHDQILRNFDDYADKLALVIYTSL